MIKLAIQATYGAILMIALWLSIGTSVDGNLIGVPLALLFGTLFFIFIKNMKPDN